jgi:hypothetical protein
VNNCLILNFGTGRRFGLLGKAMSKASPVASCGAIDSSRSKRPFNSDWLRS